MALTAKINKESEEFGVGDVVRVHQKLIEGGKTKGPRKHIFEGTVIKIKGHAPSKTFTVRRIGVQKIGIEMIFPLLSPYIEKVEVVRKGLKGVRRSKLYYIRDKSKKEIEQIYSRANRRGAPSKHSAKRGKAQKTASK